MTDVEVLNRLKIGNYISFSGSLRCLNEIEHPIWIPNGQFFEIKDHQSRMTLTKREFQIKLYFGNTLLAPIFFSDEVMDIIERPISLVGLTYRDKLLEIIQ